MLYMQEKNNKKVIVMVTIIILVILIGILIYVFGVGYNKTDDSKNPNVNNNVSNDNKTNNDKDNRSIVLANVKFLTSDYLEKEKGTKYYIYKDANQKGDDEYYYS